DPAEPLDGGAGEGDVRLLGALVGGDEDAPAAGGLDVLARLLGVLLLDLEGGDGDVGALLGEGDRGGAPDAGVAAGDEGAFALEAAAADVARLPVVGHRVEAVGPAGPGLALLREVLHGGGVDVHAHHPSGGGERAHPECGVVGAAAVGICWHRHGRGT